MKAPAHNKLVETSHNANRQQIWKKACALVVFFHTIYKRSLTLFNLTIRLSSMPASTQSASVFVSTSGNIYSLIHQSQFRFDSIIFELSDLDRSRNLNPEMAPYRVSSRCLFLMATRLPLGADTNLTCFQDPRNSIFPVS